MTTEEHVSPFTKVLHNSSRFFIIHKTYAAALLIITLAIVGLGFFSKTETGADAFTVTAGSIKQSVSVSGSVEASKDAKLSFQSSGQVAYVGVKVGDKVAQGKILATLQAGDVQASLLEAEALLANRQATLDQLLEGSRKEELAIKEQTVSNAKNSLAQAYSGLPDVIKNTDAVTSDTIKNKFSNLFTFNGAQFVLSFSSCDQRLQGALELKRTELENVLADFQKKSGVVSVISSEETLDTALSAAYLAAARLLRKSTESLWKPSTPRSLMSFAESRDLNAATTSSSSALRFVAPLSISLMRFSASASRAFARSIASRALRSSLVTSAQPAMPPADPMAA
jgi:multidrug efflux pump subunit AcrA (membrane-fusion protein)